MTCWFNYDMLMPKEVYLMKPIKNYEGLYEIDEYGNVYRIAYDKNRKYNSKELPYLIKPKIDKDGYLRLALSNKGKTKYYYVHRLVALSYLENKDNLPCVNHIDGNKRNNHYKNLEFCTVRYNNLHALNTGLRDMKNNKLSKQVEQFDLQGNLIETYKSANDAKRITGYSQGHISECCRGEIKQYNGYVWKYKVN